MAIDRETSARLTAVQARVRSLYHTIPADDRRADDVKIIEIQIAAWEQFRDQRAALLATIKKLEKGAH